eukprot:m.111903 g.111903  ORF g.111903 m.111903 type:complete len:588 (+) comp15401_c0_seq8:296-2059(+)
MATFFDIPQDTVIEYILPCLTLADMAALQRVSRRAYELVRCVNGLMLHWMIQPTLAPRVCKPIPSLKATALNLQSLPMPEFDTSRWLLQQGHSFVRVFACAAALGDTTMLTAIAPQLSQKQLQQGFQEALLNAAINDRGNVMAWLMAPGRLEQKPGQAALTFTSCKHCRHVWTAVFAEAFNASHLPLCDQIVEFMHWSASDRVYHLFVSTQDLVPTTPQALLWLQRLLSEQQEQHVLHAALLRCVKQRQLALFPTICQRLERLSQRGQPQAAFPPGLQAASVVTALVKSSCQGEEEDESVRHCLQALHACKLLTVTSVLSTEIRLDHQHLASPAFLLMIRHGYIASTAFVIEAVLLPLEELSLVLLMQPQAGLQAIVTAAVQSELPLMFDLVVDSLVSKNQLQPPRSKAFQHACSLGFVYAIDTICSRTNFDLAALRALQYRPLINALRSQGNILPTLTHLAKHWGFGVQDALASRLPQRLLATGCTEALDQLGKLLDFGSVTCLAKEMLTMVCRKDLVDALPLILGMFEWRSSELYDLCKLLAAEYNNHTVQLLQGHVRKQRLIGGSHHHLAYAFRQPVVLRLALV